MSIFGAASNPSASSQQILPLTQHKRRPSISDVDMQSANAASTPRANGKTGSKVDFTA
jgi:hypothetical protein